MLMLVLEVGCWMRMLVLEVECWMLVIGCWTWMRNVEMVVDDGY